MITLDDIPPLPSDEAALFQRFDRVRSVLALTSLRIDEKATPLFDRLEQDIAPIEGKRRRMEEAIAKLGKIEA